jgi:DNA polymerase-3 subunit delta'
MHNNPTKYNIYPWQQSQWQYLTARINNNTLPHALLLKGPNGIGKSAFALSLAELLLCERNTMDSRLRGNDNRDCGNDNGGCGTCKSCKLFAVKTHPDLYLLQPEDDSKIIKIEQVREIIFATTKKSNQNGYQVVIIDPADTMHTAASNALLKTLEEPSGAVIFILATHRPSSLPATIRSRCQQIIFNAPAKQIVKTWLQQKNIPIEHTNLLINLTENAPLSIVHLAQDAFIQQRHDLLKNLALLLTKQLDPLKFAAGLHMELALLLKILHSYFMDIMRLKFNLPEKFIINSDQIPILSNLSATISSKKIFASLDKIITLSKYSDHNLNQLLMLEDLGISLC